MQNPPTIHYNNRGEEAIYDPATDTCRVIVRGYPTPDGRIVTRGGPAHMDDKPAMKFMLGTSCAKLAGLDGGVAPCPSNPVRETFHDALLDRRDLLGATIFRNKPANDAERRLFAAAYDAAQKIRSGSAVLSVGKLFFSLHPPIFAVVDCFSRDKSGAFWLMSASERDCGALPLAAYVLEAGEYVPPNATVRLGVWTLSHDGPRFAEVPNDRAAARDAVIAHLLSTPF